MNAATADVDPILTGGNHGTSSAGYIVATANGVLAIDGGFPAAADLILQGVSYGSTAFDLHGVWSVLDAGAVEPAGRPWRIAKVDDPRGLVFVAGGNHAGTYWSYSTVPAEGYHELQLVDAPGAKGPPVDHDLNFAPVGLWQFDSRTPSGGANVLWQDTSGHNNPLGTYGGPGNVCQAEIYPGIFGIYRCGANIPVPGVGGSGPALLQIFGDMTIEALIRPDMPASLNQVSIVTFGSGNSWANAGWNAAYELTFNAQLVPVWRQQRNALSGGYDSYQLDGYSLPGGLFHFAATRTAGVIQFYVNGRALGPPSAALAAPDGGANARFYVTPAFNNSTCYAAIRSLKIIASALTAAQIKGEFNRTLGPVYGLAA